VGTPSLAFFLLTSVELGLVDCGEALAGVLKLLKPVVDERPSGFFASSLTRVVFAG